MNTPFASYTFIIKGLTGVLFIISTKPPSKNVFKLFAYVLFCLHIKPCFNFLFFFFQKTFFLCLPHCFLVSWTCCFWRHNLYPFLFYYFTFIIISYGSINTPFLFCFWIWLNFWFCFWICLNFWFLIVFRYLSNHFISSHFIVFSFK